ncbi:TPA: metallophosphoesterase [Clostridioides difficile]|uniref:Membrane-associated nucleotidase n=4 Tax=Clostridioides difficile TaxID=1496 RepID=A0AB74QGU4_CLODI|nr:metallophosphoesterase [Clostridioides difficile]AKP41305.1 membrane-associated nucleotidase [Clostridioides difficile ATCC 9689 = DSM 1296]EQE23270.1 calcineurin-like phosphoesterase family protein [Clostridioides difficile CD18]EQE50443.1 calcineurin-like phosphoesterase family protein [Clostridioides difficile CD40]EQE57775.1 calcineurin-like phosphoesterase family protein [Clostridioides difficile CD43]EQE70478.1 calcineurin-like phosphoesterase family protein [Clostridioides difficile 
MILNQIFIEAGGIMRNKIIIGITFSLVLLMSGCASKQTAEINVLATTDLHGVIPYELTSYVKEERKKDKNLTLVDAGDFFDSGEVFGSSMDSYFSARYKDGDNNTESYIETPISKDMKEVGYDVAVLGNHEFISNNKFYLDNMISDFEKQKINILSANTYKKNGDSYTKPYIIKNINTPEGNVKLGILGLTIKEVGERKQWKDGKLVDSKSLELKDQEGYNGELYMNDLVEDAKKWVSIMEKEKPDIIVAVAHTGEKPKKPRNPGNRIQDLAQQVDGIDAIVAGHNHVQIEQHDYKNKSGENVIVTEPGKHGECISKINFKLEKNNDKWNIVDKSSKLIKFEKNQESDKFGEFISSINKVSKDKKEIRLSEVKTPEWDKIYVFKSGTSADDIYKTIGYKWRNISSPKGDDMVQIVVMNNNKPVSYVYGEAEVMPINIKCDESEYKDNVVTIYPNKNDKFKIEKGKQEYSINLKHIQ